MEMKRETHLALNLAHSKRAKNIGCHCYKWYHYSDPFLFKSEDMTLGKAGVSFPLLDSVSWSTSKFDDIQDPGPP